MSSETLSQEEVDALLHGLSGTSESQEVDPESPDGTRPYDLRNQERIVRGRMPTLEVINERFSRLIRIGIFGLMRRTPEISLNPIRVVKYSEFVRNLMVPTNLNLVQVKPLRGTALFICDPKLIFTVVDTMFGGSGSIQTRIEGRDFSQTEQRIIQRLLGVVLTEYQKAWESVYRLQFEYLRSEMHTQFANIATPTEPVVAASFGLDFGGSGGELHICLPYSMVEPIRDVLYSSVQSEGAEPDERWLHTLSREIQGIDVSLTANLAKIPMRLGQMLHMRVGDVIPVDMPRALVAEVEGVPMFECRYGTSNGKYSLKIDKVIGPSKQDATSGARHGK
jgi:flagellar motor switch protein FliM